VVYNNIIWNFCLLGKEESLLFGAAHFWATISRVELFVNYPQMCWKIRISFEILPVEHAKIYTMAGTMPHV
jgi:hypothetical protein